MFGGLFSLKGRLSRAAHRRLERRMLLLAAVGWLVPLGLLIAGAPGAVAVAPFVCVPVCGFALFAAYVRRLHDVGRHWRHEFAKGLLVAVILAAPLVILIAIPDLPQWTFLGLLGMAALTFLAGAFTGWRGSSAWGPGDPGPNAFGLPPPN